MPKKNDNSKRTARLTLIGVLLIIVFLGGVFLGRGTVADTERRSLDLTSFLQNEKVNFGLIEKVWNLINEDFVNADDLDRDSLILGAIRGMVEALDDPHSVFFDEEQTRNFITALQGEFEGIGIEINIREDRLTVIAPLKDMPAARAGMLAGDIITKIDRESAEGITLEEAVTKIRGPKGTAVVLTLERSGKELDVTIVRDTIEVPTTELELIDNIAVIELSQFSEKASNDFENAAREVLNSNADRILLDLRNNPGGFLDASINIAGWFIPEGKLIVREEMGGGQERRHISSGPALLKDFPVVILQNEGSASASEILAGAMRDHLDATIIGTRSFGKGTVQNFTNMDGGTSLKLTVARWITPSGEAIDQKGIEPTITVEANTEEILVGNDAQRERALEILRNL